jgi:lambda family phage portal protein
MKKSSPRRRRESAKASKKRKTNLDSRLRGNDKRRSALSPQHPSTELRTGSALKVRASYEAGSAGRRLRLWQPGMIGPNDAVLRDLTQIRDRSRDLVRNNPWISRALKSWVANEIGCAITFKAETPDLEFNKAADELWERQQEYFDADGMLDFQGMLAQIVRTRRAAGEIFIRRRVRRPDGTLPVPLQYQLLEPEFCPHDQVNNFAPFPGRQIKAGIEFDGIGQRRAYFMYRNHPGDSFNTTIDLNIVAVPASEIIHHYEILRPGQIRGIPAIVQALIRAKEFDEYDDAELQRKRNRAAYTGVLRRATFGEEDYKYDPFTGELLETDSAGVGIQNIEGGSMIQLLPGEDVTMFEGDSTGQGYADFIHQQILGIGAGLDVPAEFVSGDFSKLNDRTLRVVLAEYHRTLEQDRWHLTVPQVCYPIWRDFIDMAILAGALPTPAGYATNREQYLKVNCHPEGWDYLHALQDAQSDVIRWKNGLTSRKRIAAESGEDIREIDQENQEDQKRADDLGLTYGADANADTGADPGENEPEKVAAARLKRFRAVNSSLYY